MDYSAYLMSEDWKRTRDKIVATYLRCQRCLGTSYLCVHHKNYSSIGKERYSDLVLLCHSCHSSYHSLFGKVPTSKTTDDFIRMLNPTYKASDSRERVLDRKSKKKKTKPDTKRWKYEKKMEMKMHRKDSSVTVRKATEEDMKRFGY